MSATSSRQRATRRRTPPASSYRVTQEPPGGRCHRVVANLEPFPASEIQLTDDGNTLRFTTSSWNRVAPMELVGGEITATVSVAAGGSKDDPVWILHVGNAVLPDAFIVTR